MRASTSGARPARPVSSRRRTGTYGDCRRKERAKRRHLRIRKKVFGTPQRPRLAVFRSLHHIYAQVIDDLADTPVSASTVEPEVRKAQEHRQYRGC